MAEKDIKDAVEVVTAAQIAIIECQIMMKRCNELIAEIQASKK